MSIPTYFCLGRDHFRPRGASDCSRDETRIWGKSLKFEISKNQTMIQDEVNKLLKKGVVVECQHGTCRVYFTHFLEGKDSRNPKAHP